MAVTLRYFTEVGKPALQKRSVAEFIQESIVFLVHVQCRRKESSRSLSHLLMSFLLNVDDDILQGLEDFMEKYLDIFSHLCIFCKYSQGCWSDLGVLHAPKSMRPIPRRG